MKRVLLIGVTLVFIISCSSSRRIEKAVNTGNYDYAISNALNKLQTNKNKSRKADYILMLKDAYDKANQRDMENVSFLKTTNNPENYIKIYDLYAGLDTRQQRVRPLLPLYVDGKEVQFQMKNYAAEISKAIDKASAHMYDNALAVINTNNSTKEDLRWAYQQFTEIEAINPNYKETRALTQEAYQRGVDFVLVEMNNETDKLIPERLERDLLNFSTYGLNDLWTVYHNTADKQLNYDYKMVVNFRDINVSPEQVRERQIIKEKEIADGKKLLLDEQGNKVKDSLGNAIEVDHLKTVRCEYYEFTQFKAVQVTGNVEYYNLISKQLTDAFPVSSEFVFEHIYASANGDRRALEQSLLPFLDQRAVPFPSEEQMIYDSGEDLKFQMKSSVNSYALK